MPDNQPHYISFIDAIGGAVDVRWMMITVAAIKRKAQKIDFPDFVPSLLYSFPNCDIIKPIFLYERGRKCLLDVRRNLNR